MNLLKPTQISDGVFQIWGVGSKVTVIEDDGRLICIDAGGLGSLGFISSGINALGHTLSNVKLIAMTHYHPDHSGGLGKLVEASSAEVAAHRLEADMLTRKKRPPSPFRNRFVSRIVRPLLSPLYGNGVHVDHILEDGDLLPASGEIRVIHTPGHTMGSLCYYIPSKRMIIVGDALQYRMRRLSLPASAVTFDMGQAAQSLEKLLRLDFDIICFSHFPPLNENAHATLGELADKVGVTY